MILWIKTDQPDAHIKLTKNDMVLAQETWHAHRELSNTLLLKIDKLLQGVDATLKDLEAVYVYKGPGSFTGLRIGVTVANSLGYSLSVPVCGIDDQVWRSGEYAESADSQYALPEYGAEANITKQKK